jgi:hypothetical protein
LSCQLLSPHCLLTLLLLLRRRQQSHHISQLSQPLLCVFNAPESADDAAVGARAFESLNVLGGTSCNLQTYKSASTYKWMSVQNVFSSSTPSHVVFMPLNLQCKEEPAET